MADISALPPGVNLQGDLGPHLILVISIVTGLSTVALVLRLISRHLKRTSMSASDYTIIVGWLAAWGITAVNYAGVAFGLGKHVEVVPVGSVMKLRKIAFASEILYSITLASTKVSLILFYRSIFPGRGFAITTNIVGAFVIAWGIACLLVSIFACNPIQGFWDTTIPSTCIDVRAFYIGNAVPNILTDVVILALPIKYIWCLQMCWKQKLVVSGMFLLGSFVCISSGIRLYFLLEMDRQDITWSYYGLKVWSMMEVNTAVISACLPTMRPVLQHILHKFRSLVSSRGSALKDVDHGCDSSQYPKTCVLNRKERDSVDQLSDLA